MLEPAAQTDKSLRVLQDDFTLFFQTLCHLNGDPRSVQEDVASHLGMISVKPISKNRVDAYAPLIERDEGGRGPLLALRAIQPLTG